MITHDTCDIDDAAILQCSESCSESSDSPPNLTTSIRKFVQDQVNKTYERTFKKAPDPCNKIYELNATESCPKLNVGCVDNRLNKSCEFRPRIKACCDPVKFSGRRRVQFVGKLCNHVNTDVKFCQRCKDILDSVPCSSVNSCKHIEFC